MNKKLSTLVLLIFGIINICSAFFYEDSTDIPDWAFAAIENVRKEKIMTGFGDGTFRPDTNLNRAQAVTILLRMKRIPYESVSGESKFPDVLDDQWFTKPVIKATNENWLKGYPDGKFYPEKELNRAEWAMLLKRAFNLEGEENPEYKDVPSNVWYSKAIFALHKNELIRSKSVYFHPEEIINRAEAAWVVNEIINKPRLMGTSKENDFSKNRRTNSRKIALKPRDFNAEKQGFDIEKKELQFSAITKEDRIKMTQKSDWTEVGKIRFKNTLDDRVTVNSIELRLRFDDNVGPEGEFFYKFKCGELIIEKLVSSQGQMFLSGLNQTLLPEDEKVCFLKIKPNPEGNFYTKSGKGIFSIITGDGTMISESVKGYDNYRFAPIGIKDRRLSIIEFELEK